MTKRLTLISKETFHPNILDLQGNWNSGFNWNWCNQNLPTFSSLAWSITLGITGDMLLSDLSLWTTALTGKGRVGEKNKFTVISGAQQNILCAMSKVQMITGSKRDRNCIYLQKVRLTLHGISDEPVREGIQTGHNLVSIATFTEQVFCASHGSEYFAHNNPLFLSVFWYWDCDYYSRSAHEETEAYTA